MRQTQPHRVIKLLNCRSLQYVCSSFSLFISSYLILYLNQYSRRQQVGFSFCVRPPGWANLSGGVKRDCFRQVYVAKLNFLPSTPNPITRRSRRTIYFLSVTLPFQKAPHLHDDICDFLNRLFVEVEQFGWTHPMFDTFGLQFGVSAHLAWERWMIRPSL